MPLRDRLILARQLAKAVGAVAADAAAAPLGRALPDSPRALTDPRCLAGLLAAGSLAKACPERITRTPHEAPSSNCQNSVLAVDWADSAVGCARPASVFVKQPARELSIRLFANVIGFWKIECAVCRSLAGSLPIETPEVYGVHERRSRFVLLMENLRERPATRLFVNRHLLQGVDLATARRCLAALAKLHAHFAGWKAEDRERALPLALHPFLSPSLGPILLAVNRLAVSPCHARAPEVFDDACAALYRRALASWPTLQETWYREPLTLAHGDSHLGNFFVSGEEMGMLDFQGAHWSQGMRDVQYFLINSMDAGLLAEHETALVEHYAAEATRLGAPLDADEAWDRYRGFSFQTLMTAVVSLGLGSFSDSDAVMRTMLERAVAATRRLGFAEWLDAREKARAQARSR